MSGGPCPHYHVSDIVRFWLVQDLWIWLLFNCLQDRLNHVLQIPASMHLFAFLCNCGLSLFGASRAQERHLAISISASPTWASWKISHKHFLKFYSGYHAFLRANTQYASNWLPVFCNGLNQVKFHGSHLRRLVIGKKLNEAPSWPHPYCWTLPEDSIQSTLVSFSTDRKNSKGQCT